MFEFLDIELLPKRPFHNVKWARDREASRIVDHIDYET
jgi:hypothetical protein